MDGPEVMPDLSKLVFQFSPQIEQLAAALAKAQGTFENAKKEKTNVHLSASKYASLGCVMDCIRKPLSENGIAYMQPVSMLSTGEQGLVTMLVHESGQWVQSILPIPKMEQKGLNELQSFGLALSYLRRYMLQSITGLASEDDDAASAGKGKSSPQSTAGNQTQKPASQGSASKGAPPAAPGTSTASPANPAGSDSTPKQDGLPTLGGVTYNQVNGEIHASGKSAYDHRETLKACGFQFRGSDKAWVKKAA